MRVGAEAALDRRNHFAHHVVGPVAFGPVVPVAVFAAVRKGDDRRPATELREAVEDRLVAGEGVVGAAAAVEEDEQRPLAARLGQPRRHDHVDAKLAPDRGAVDRQVLDPGAVLVDRPEGRRCQHQVDDRSEHDREDCHGDPSPPFGLGPRG